MTNLPTLKLKSLVSFPAQVYGGGGIAVSKLNGQYTITLDCSRYPTAGIAAADLPNTYVLTYNVVSKAYVLAPYGGSGALTTSVPTTKTTSYSQVAADNSLIFNGGASITLTLLSAASVPGQWLNVKTVAAFTVISASSNVVPLGGGSAGTAILAATIGKWAQLQSDGTNWIVMAAN